MRVAVVARAVMPLHGFGGLERHVHDLVRHLAARGVHVTLITPPARSGSDVRGADPFGSPLVTLRPVPYVTFPFAGRRGTTVIDRSTAYPIFGLRAGRVALSLVREGSIDIVHGLGASVLGYALARRRATAPLVFNPQGLEEFGASDASAEPLKRLGYLPLRAAVLACARAADRIIATDRALEPVVIQHLHPKPGQLRTIPNAIDLAAVDAIAGPSDGARIRQQAGIDADALVIVSVGRLEANKGFDTLAAALGRAAHLRSSSVGGQTPIGDSLASPRWRWVLVGSGPFRRDIEQAVARHGIGAHTIFTGRASEADLHAWYEAASFFAHPTRYEGSSLVTLEAMAHRKAVVATRAGGLPDKVRPGDNGWLVAPGDVEALAGVIEDAAGDPQRLASMGARSRTIVEQEFAWSTVVDRQIDVYLELLGTVRAARHSSDTGC
jgi:glycosyltransferase involved in cell wall biosynthesis